MTLLVLYNFFIYIGCCSNPVEIVSQNWKLPPIFGWTLKERFQTTTCKSICMYRECIQIYQYIYISMIYVLWCLSKTLSHEMTYFTMFNQRATCTHTHTLLPSHESRIYTDTVHTRCCNHKHQIETCIYIQAFHAFSIQTQTEQSKQVSQLKLSRWKDLKS